MSEHVYPFKEQGHYTVFHDEIIDTLMPRLSGNEWKIVSLVVRKTRGWKKERDTLTYQQIIEGTGIKSQVTVSKALANLIGDEEKPVEERNGVLLRWRKKADKHWQFGTIEYSLNPNYRLETDTENVDVARTETTTENGVETTTENEVATTTENVDTNNQPSQVPPEEPSLSPEGELRVRNGRVRVKGLTDEEAQNHIATAAEELPASLIPLLETMIKNAAAENQSGSMLITRVWSSFYGPLLSYYRRLELPDKAWEHALEETNRREKTNFMYTLEVAKNWQPRRGTHLYVVTDQSDADASSREEFNRRFGGK